MNLPLILELGRNFAQNKHWHLAKFILGSSHQLVSSRLVMMQFIKCSHKLSFSSPVPLFFNPAGMKWRGRGPEKIMGKLWEMFSILMWNDIQGAHKAATDLYTLRPVPRWILEDTCRNSMNQLYFDNDFRILPSKFCTHRYLRRKNTCRFIHTVQPCVNYGKTESYTSLLKKAKMMKCRWG